MNFGVRFIVSTFCFFFCAMLGALFYFMAHHTVDFTPLTHYNPGKPSLLLDDQGIEWARFALDRREPISLDQMPLNLRNAFIAAEDWQFFSHNGISFKGIIRSVLINLRHGKKMQGASTITQQLVKLLFFDSQKTFKRKIQEQLYAYLAEQQFTKEQILQTYLNHVYFGFGIYGVQAASHRFWAKDTSQLTLAQSATLAAIIRSPAHYCPLLNPLSCMRRRNMILRSMKNLDFITPQDYEYALNEPLTICEGPQTIAPHLKEMLRVQLEQQFGKQRLYTGGLIIQTTLNRDIQEQAQKSFQEKIKELKATINPAIDGALLTIECKTGHIKALVGGYDFKQSKFNRAWQARRQMGSVFKPLIYAAALKNGANFFDTEIDEPLHLEQPNGVWQPNNYDNRFNGTMTLAQALVQSNNIIAVKTLLKTGIANVVHLASACFIDHVPAYPSLALGCIDATLQEAVGMFNIFANDGIYIMPTALAWIKDEWGTKLYKPIAKSKLVVPPVIAHKVAKVLEHSSNRWQATLSNPIASGVISKTGTTNECRTCWFAGATPELTTVVWVGCDDNSSMGDVYPSKTAFPIWLGFHSTVASVQKQFVYDQSLHVKRINLWTGRITSSSDPEGIEILV